MTSRLDRTHLDCSDCARHIQGEVPADCRVCTNEQERSGVWLPLFIERNPVNETAAPDIRPIFTTLDVDQKPTNPKDAIGSTKLPLNLVPDTLTIFAAASFAEGASKYGAYNWRSAGVRASIYRAALERHLKKWWNGEECDPATKVPHLSSVIACAAIILDAKACDKLTDDRPPKVDVGGLIEGLEDVVKGVYAMHAHLTPHHHTALDPA